jgi:hypothetical protein
VARRRRTGAAQIFEQHDHFVLLIGEARPRSAHTRALEAVELSGEIGAVAREPFQDAGSQEFGDELQLVGGEALQETAGLGFQGRIST